MLVIFIRSVTLSYEEKAIKSEADAFKCRQIAPSAHHEKGACDQKLEAALSSSWEHILVSLIATLPSIVAAVSSVRNGRALTNAAKLKKHSEKLDGKKVAGSGWLSGPHGKN